jgi:hypothetical protein
MPFPKPFPLFFDLFPELVWSELSVANGLFYRLRNMTLNIRKEVTMLESLLASSCSITRWLLSLPI